MEGSETVTVSGTTTASGITTVNPATLTIIDNETPNNPPTGQPRITGTARVGQTLTAVTADIQDADGPGRLLVSVEGRRNEYRRGNGFKLHADQQ